MASPPSAICSPNMRGRASSTRSVQQPTFFAHCSMHSACFAPRWTSLLKSPTSGAAFLSAAVSAPASRDAMTCVVPPIEQPYCSADENRLYTSRCVMNCSAYDSSFERPLAVKPSSIIEWMLCQKSWLFIFDMFESLSNDAQKYNFFQIVAIGLFTP